jgi:sugar lactone lactonase YvrE
VKLLCAACVLFFLAVVNAFAEVPTIATYAGMPFPINGAKANTQEIDFPGFIAPDRSGGYYISSGLLNRIYRVSADGTLTAVTSGLYGFGGDNGPAIFAQLALVAEITTDRQGNLFIADEDNHRVRKVGRDGVITTVAGKGTYLDQSFGSSGDGGPATQASLGYFLGIAVDSLGNLFIAEDQRIRKVTPAGIISTVAVEGNDFFAHIAIGNNDTIYVSDTSNRVFTLDQTTGGFTVVAGAGAGYSGDGGPATAARLLRPHGLAADNQGNLYIADTGNNCIRKVNAAGIISTVAGVCSTVYGFSGDGGFATAAQLAQPERLFVDDGGTLFIADTENSRTRRVTTDGIISTVAGVGTYAFGGDGGPAAAARLSWPYGMSVDSAGNLFIADSQNGRIRKVTPAGTITTVAGGGVNIGDGLALDAQLFSPQNIAVDAAGNLFISENAMNRIRKVSPTGQITTIGATDFSSPAGIAVDAAGNVYVADSFNHRIRKIDPSGITTTIAGTGTAGFGGDGGPAISASLNYPSGVAVDASGNVLIVDTSNQRIRKVDPSGNITTIIGNGVRGFSGDGGPANAAELADPNAIALDSAGTIYLGDFGAGRVRKVTADGMINTIAGSGSRGNTGDNGPALTANIIVQGITVDAKGNLYIADAYSRIRKIEIAGMPRVGSFAQVASGGSWDTKLTLINTSGARVHYRINFYKDSGAPMILPLAYSQTGIRTSSLTGDIEPQGSAVIEAVDQLSDLATGWADVEGSGPLSGYLVFRLRTPGIPDSEGTVTLDTRGGAALVFPFDNTSGYRTGMALANEAGTGIVVNATLRDDTGLIIQTSQITLQALGHDAFFIADRFAASANQRGLLELSTPLGAITGIGLRFSPSLSFTDLPPLN